MAFAVIIPKIPTSIGVISIELYDGDGTVPERAARYDIEVMDQNDVTMQGRRGDLIQHLEPADVAWLIDFQNRMRAKAIAEIIQAME